MNEKIVRKQYSLCLALFQYQGLCQQICVVWSSKNPQQYPEKLEDLIPTVLEAKLASCLVKLRLSQSNDRAVSAEENTYSFVQDPEI